MRVCAYVRVVCSSVCVGFRACVQFYVLDFVRVLVRMSSCMSVCLFLWVCVIVFVCFPECLFVCVCFFFRDFVCICVCLYVDIHLRAEIRVEAFLDMPVCCWCNGGGRCKFCICAKSGRSCVDCLPSRKGHCYSNAPNNAPSTTSVYVCEFVCVGVRANVCMCVCGKGRK